MQRHGRRLGGSLKACVVEDGGSQWQDRDTTEADAGDELGGSGWEL